MEEELVGLCKWLKEEKGITKIDMMELAGFLPEYEQWLEKHLKGQIVNCKHNQEPIIDKDGFEVCPDCGKYGEDC